MDAFFEKINEVLAWLEEFIEKIINLISGATNKEEE